MTKKTEGILDEILKAVTAFIRARGGDPSWPVPDNFEGESWIISGTKWAGWMHTTPPNLEVAAAPTAADANGLMAAMDELMGFFCAAKKEEQIQVALPPLTANDAIEAFILGRLIHGPADLLRAIQAARQ